MVVGRTMAMMSLFRVLRTLERALCVGATYGRSPYFTPSVTQVIIIFKLQGIRADKHWSNCRAYRQGNIKRDLHPEALDNEPKKSTYDIVMNGSAKAIKWAMLRTKLLFHN